MSRLVQVTTTVGSREDAERIGQSIVADRLAACAQVVGPVTSSYWWQERMESVTEWFCNLKTTSELYPALEARLRGLHPYELPEIVTQSLDGTAEYADWVASVVRLPIA